MIPFGNQLVTLVQRVETKVDGKTRVAYSRHLLTGCSWREKAIWQQVGTDMQRSVEITCRIPKGQIDPIPGDYLLLGDVAVDISSTAALNATIAAYYPDAMRVASVSNNALAGFPMPHIAARGNAP